MSNSFNISVKPEIAAVKADTADIRTDVTAIHDTDLPAVKTDTADIRTDVTAIHDTNLPAVKTVVDNNAVSLAALYNRGTLLSVYDGSPANVWEDVLNVSGSGILYLILFENTDGGTTGDIRITIDGILSRELSFGGDISEYSVIIDADRIDLNYFELRLIAADTGDYNPLNIEFSTSLIIEHKASIPGVAQNFVKAFYNLDGA